MLHSVFGLLCIAISAAAAPTPASVRVIVTGASGRTGSELYRLLKADPRVSEVRGLVFNASKAATILNCSKCDASEGIFEGDVTKPATLVQAFSGVNTVAIAVGSPYGASKNEVKNIEFTGVENQLAALGNGSSSLSDLRVVFCSSGQTTNPNPPAFEGGVSLFWKLNAEAFIGGTGIGATIVKPCGLNTNAPSKHRLVVAHDDKLPFPGVLESVSLKDVARVMAEATAQRTRNLRFDLCGGLGGKPTVDPNEVLLAARLPWQPH